MLIISRNSDDKPPAVLHAVWRRVRDVLLPPPKLTISEWADKHRVLGPSSPLPGQWRTDVAPFLREPMDCLSPDSGIERLVVMKSVQTGFTETLLNAAAFYLTHCPSAVMIVQPNESMAKRLSRQRVESLIELCDVLRPLVAKQRAQGGNEVFLKTTRNGGLLAIASAQSPSALRSLPARVVLCDEVDSYLADIGEGAPFDLAAARATTFGSLRKVAAISTPTEAETSLIERLFLETDQRRWNCPCPHCEFPQVLTWGNLRWEPGQPETAHYQCVACAAAIDESSKAAMVAAGTWKPQAVCPAHVRGYHVNALVSPWMRWSELVEQFEASQDSPERRKTFVNLVLAETYSPPALETPQAEELQARAEPFQEGVVPQGGAFLTGGVDVQADRVECEVVAWGRNFESWSVDYQIVYGDITEPEIWNRLDELLSRSWPHVSGMPMTLQAVAIDSGFSPSEVTQFTRNKHGRRIYATKGASNGWSRPIWPRRASWSRNKDAIYLISSDESKAWVATRMKITSGAGCMHFPLGREKSWYQQLTAERLVFVKGAKKWTNPLRSRNEACDCRALSVAALHSRLLSNVDLNAWCDAFEKMLEPPKPQAALPVVNGAPQSAVIVRSRFVYG